MNKHDSERVCGTLDANGAFQVQDVEDADIVILLTCCVREAADTRLFGQLESMKSLLKTILGRSEEAQQFLHAAFQKSRSKMAKLTALLQ